MRDHVNHEVRLITGITVYFKSRLFTSKSCYYDLYETTNGEPYLIKQNKADSGKETYERIGPSQEVRHELESEILNHGIQLKSEDHYPDYKVFLTNDHEYVRIQEIRHHLLIGDTIAYESYYRRIK